MAENINLIPQEEKKEQAKQRAVKNSTLIAIGLLVLVGLVTGFFYYQNFNTQQEIDRLDSSIGSLRAQIQGMSEIEISARNLGTKYEVIRGFLGSREHYSVVMQEFENRIPANLAIDTFGLGKDNTLNISGSGTDYISIAKFVNDLSDPNFADAGEGLGALFTNVSLNSVNLDAQTSRARFFIVVTYDGALLRQ